MGYQEHDGPMTVESPAEGVYLFRPATADELAASATEATDDAAPAPGGLYADKCDECTTGVRCEDAGRCLFSYFEDGGE